ncbi:2-oxoisovalerate dehydrogenase E1 component [Nannocystis exedens]|uniref:3-methyl-2-oxobutanoate dehydrogenase (2-methylpropanoyl-transferring) n=1 Tax=Nannocystis exedens TaxID=54 RepID=A0A1I2A838_9BACT|nr:transketolase C-terminal domain-containing protein [Nannocystis exedens]PCC69704.1 2-oxoisovalerate dehydrogenase E1 component alpha and subunit beta [Nannocystis exedens]SFE40264.1 2-oxoisovalerate dehydrogenase E1 component [Nannocystis exedens]
MDMPTLSKNLRFDLRDLPRFPSLTPELLRLAYQEMLIARCHVERVVQECAKGTIKFAIWGSGEELHGAAEAIAYAEVVNPEAFGICAHYRSAGLLAMWSRLRGYQDFHLDHMRQQLCKATDPWTGGRLMTAHFNDLRFNTLPVQSALGMQFGKAVGYAQGLRRKGHDDGLVVAVVGDGTTAESDMHEGMTGASILRLPVLLTITDNNVAISVRPEDGRGIRSFEHYAAAFGFAYFECDGNDFLGCYETARAAAEYCKEQQAPALMWVKNLSRLNNHSSAADFTFEFDSYDPLIDFGEALVQAGVLAPHEILRRNAITEGKDYFRRHDWGTLAKAADDYVVETMAICATEPEPTYESVLSDIRAPFPAVEEAPPENRPTAISINGAIRSALQAILKANPMSWVYGQDVGKKGGVMVATKGLYERFPDQVRDAPINEPLILGTAFGFALHKGATAIPEIQFSDYSLNTLHWLVLLGNQRWQSAGTVDVNVILRLPVEPLHGGSVYHSMCMEGFYASIPGITIVAPTTSRDMYGLLRSAAEYPGPVLVFESKGLYRMTLGDAFPGEPTDPKEIAALKRSIGFGGHIPDLPDDFRVPLGKAALRRPGKDITVVTWGRCTLFCGEAVQKLAAEGVDVELIDLRTIVPYDSEAVLASVRKTGRLLVVHEDRVFASLGREIQGAVQEAMAGENVITRVLGQDPSPGIPSPIEIEEQIVVSPEKVHAAVLEVMSIRRVAPARPAADSAAPARPARGGADVFARPQILWTPSRNSVT